MSFSMFRVLILFSAFFFINSCASMPPNTTHRQNAAQKQHKQFESADTQAEKASTKDNCSNEPSSNQRLQESLENPSPSNIPGPHSHASLNSDEPARHPTDRHLEPIRFDKTIQELLDDALDYCQTSQEFWQKGELENALEALDQAYALILQVDTHNIPKLIQQKEDLRFTISKRILEIYASRHIVLNGNHRAIPLMMNEHIEKEIKSFQGVEKKFFIASYKRSGKFRPYIVAELEKNGLPTELSWLPLIESGFKVRALSKARALGLWQFIPSTGYKFGLKRNTYIDERLDPEKSTQAAIDYLKELHQMFGDWATVLAAYNCGEGRVLQVIRDQNINYLDHFWDLYQRLPLETARYVPRFMATLQIIKNPEKYGFEFPKPDPPMSFDIATVNREIHLNHVAKTLTVSATELSDLNPELRHKLLPAEPYTLRVPKGKANQLLAVLDSIPVSHPPRPAYVIHKVRYGESLSSIAKKYRTSVKRIMRANNLRKSNYIVAGKKLKIPLRGKYTAASYAPVQDKFDRPLTHKVRQGDSLWIIAKRYRTTTKRIQALNNLKTTRLHIGQILKISESQSPPDTKGLHTYIVKKGDSPFTIAKKHNTSLERFLRINQLSPKSSIFPGQMLYVD